MWSFIIPKLGEILMIMLEAEKESAQLLEAEATELTQPHFCQNVLVKGSHMANSDLRGREWTLPFDWKIYNKFVIILYLPH